VGQVDVAQAAGERIDRRRAHHTSLRAVGGAH
jgi:hypothetical protein